MKRKAELKAGVRNETQGPSEKDTPLNPLSRGELEKSPPEGNETPQLNLNFT